MEEEVKYKLAPNVALCHCKRGEITDDKVYPASHWEEDQAEEYVKEGFLVRVKEKEKEKEKK